jgi:hypothetical protein
MRRTMWISVLLLAATTAYAGETLGPSVAVLTDAVGARQAALGALATPTKEEMKEAKKLGKAKAILDAYTGADDKAELKKLVKAVKQIVKSKTVDPSLLTSLEGLLESFATFARENEDLVRALVDDLLTEKYKGKVEKLLEKAILILAKGEALVAAAPDKAGKTLAKSVIAYLRAIAKAQIFMLMEEDSLPAGVTFENLGAMLVNRSGQFLYVTEVSLDLQVFFPDGTVVPVKGDASTLDKEAGIPDFPYTLDGTFGEYDWVFGIMLELMGTGHPPLGPGVRIAGRVTYRFKMQHRRFRYNGRWDQTL